MKNSRTLVTLLVLSIFSLSAHAESILLKDAKNPESIGYDKNTDSLYVSSFSDGAVFKIDRKNSESSLYQKAGFEGRTTAAGIKVDSLRRHLWVIDGGAVNIYDLNKKVDDPTYRLARLERSNVVDVIAPAESFLNDVAIDADGNGYVTDSKFPRLYKVSFAQAADGGPKHFSLSVAKDLTMSIPYGVINGNGFNLNGVVLSPDAKSLLAIKTNDGALYRISLVDDKVEEVKITEDKEHGTPSRLLNGDGLAWGKDNYLYVIRNYVNKISHVKYAKTSDPLYAETLPIEGLKTPTGAVVVDNEIFITNSQFKPADPAADFDVLKISL